MVRGRVERVLGAGFRDLGPEWADRTEKHFDEAIRILDGIGARHELALALAEYGAYWHLLGEPEEARSHLKRAEALLTEVGADPDRARVLGELGEIESE